MRTAVVLSHQKRMCEEVPEKLKLWGFSGGALSFPSVPELVSYCKIKRPDLLIIDGEVAEASVVAEAIQKVRLIPGCRNAALFIVAPLFTRQILSIAADYSAQKIFKKESFEFACQAAVVALLSDLNRPSALRSYLTRIELAKEKGSWGDVDRIATELYKLYPDDFRALMEYANACLRKDRLDEARQVLLKLHKINPEDLRVVNLSARVCLKEGNYAEALLAVEKADILSPNNLDRLQIFGDIYRGRNDLETARAFYDQILEIDPAAPEAQMGKGHVELSEGDVNAALSLFKQAASGEELGAIFNNAAIFAVRMKDYPHAHRLYEAALGALESKSLKARVSFNQGLAYCKNNSLVSAFKSFQQSYKWEPKFEKNLKALKNVQMLMERDSISQKDPTQDAQLLLLEETVEGVTDGFDSSDGRIVAMEESLAVLRDKDVLVFERIELDQKSTGKVIHQNNDKQANGAVQVANSKARVKVG